MKQYKHKKLGWVAKETDLSSKYYTIENSSEGHFFLLRELIENSTDWEGGEVLFTTHDGVKVYGGEEYFYVTKSHGTRHIYDAIADRSMKYASDTVIRFSSQEAAEDYQIMNTAFFSIEDIKHHTNTYGSDTFENLRAEAKLRLSK